MLNRTTFALAAALVLAGLSDASAQSGSERQSLQLAC